MITARRHVRFTDGAFDPIQEQAMTSQPSRRFTDREVALVLRRASEIDEVEGPTAGGGLSLEDLQDIGREVGISPEAIARAVSTLGRRGSAMEGLAGAPLVHKSLHTVGGELDGAGLSELVHLVDERADGTGNVSEALGSLRWTSADRFRSLQVSLTPGAGETRIQVVDKAKPHLRRVVQLLPAAWGAMLAMPIVGTGAVGGLAIAGVLAGGAVAGGAIGRGVWSFLSARSQARVAALAEELSTRARDAVGRGQVVDDDAEGD
jgi:hypothetical protein